MFTHRLLHTKQLCSGELLCFKLLFLLGWLFLLVAAFQATCHACVFAIKLELDFSRKVIWICLCFEGNPEEMKLDFKPLALGVSKPYLIAYG